MCETGVGIIRQGIYNDFDDYFRILMGYVDNLQEHIVEYSEKESENILKIKNILIEKKNAFDGPISNSACWEKKQWTWS